MEKRTRQRITGVVLLLTLAAVLSPLVFRSPEQIRTALNMEIPPAPDYQAVVVEPVIEEAVEAAARERLVSDREDVIAEAAEPVAEQLDPEPEASEEAQDEAPERVEPAKKDGLRTLTTPPTPARQPGDDPILAGFVVQVGSYSQQDSATGLVERLKKAGYRAYTESDTQNGKLLHRVMVGPEIRKEDAEQTRQRLADDSRFNLKGLVRIYAP